MSDENDSVFVLDARLANDTQVLGESSLSLLLLMNERRYPWLILVPKRPSLSEIYELSYADRNLLIDESCVVAKTLSTTFAATKINTAALGNIVRQLHLHHVARFADDPAWPGPVWGHSAREPYADHALKDVCDKLHGTALRAHFSFRV